MKNAKGELVDEVTAERSNAEAVLFLKVPIQLSARFAVNAPVFHAFCIRQHGHHRPLQGRYLFRRSEPDRDGASIEEYQLEGRNGAIHFKLPIRDLHRLQVEVSHKA